MSAITVSNSMARKPHKGRISVTGEFPTPGLGLGYLYLCKFLDHPEFGGERGHTSYIVRDERDVPRHLNDSYEIETRNSRYTVVPLTTLRSQEEIAQASKPERSSRSLQLMYTAE